MPSNTSKRKKRLRSKASPSKLRRELEELRLKMRELETTNCLLKAERPKTTVIPFMPNNSPEFVTLHEQLQDPEFSTELKQMAIVAINCYINGETRNLYDSHGNVVGVVIDVR